MQRIQSLTVRAATRTLTGVTLWAFSCAPPAVAPPSASSVQTLGIPAQSGSAQSSSEQSSSEQSRAAQSSSVQQDVEARLSATVEVWLRGVVGQQMAVCPMTRDGAIVFDCVTGIKLVGAFPAQLISTVENPLPVTIRGQYDGDTVAVSEVLPLASANSNNVEEPYGNPCPQYQTRKNGPVNGSRSLNIETERLRAKYAERLADAVWDGAHQTMTLRFTGEVADIQSDVRSSRGDRICIVGGARLSERQWSALTDKVSAALEKLPRQSRPLLLSIGRKPLGDVLTLEFETLDRNTRGLVADIAGPDAVIGAFIELLNEPLSALPQPQYRGDIPIETSPMRTPGASMQALGHFALRIDRERACVYLANESQKRIMPSLPFGYVIKDAPLRLLDPRGQVVAAEGQVVSWGGGFVEVDAALPGACGATTRFVGRPLGESAKE